MQNRDTTLSCRGGLVEGVRNDQQGINPRPNTQSSTSYLSVPGMVWAERMELASALNDKFFIQPSISGYTDDWQLTLDLPAGRIYRFHNLCDALWMSDVSADDYERDPQDGSINCLLDTKSVSFLPQAHQDI